MSICQAFNSAKELVSREKGKIEGDTLMILTDHEKGAPCNKELKRYQFEEGTCEHKGTFPKVFKLPAPDRHLIARNADMFDVIRHLQTGRIVQIFAMPGMGKSSLIRNIANFLGERQIFKDGILYLNMHKLSTI